MPHRRPHDNPAKATAEAGEVMLDGPNGVALSLTPEAAAHTAREIALAAAEAVKQRPEDEADSAPERRS